MVRTRTGNKESAIVEAAVALFLQQGVKQSSIKQIADAAGVSVGTVYLYHDDKQAIVRAVAFAFAETHRRMVDGVLNSDEPPMVKLEKYLFTLYEMWEPFGANDKGSIDLADNIIKHANETLGIAAAEFHRAVSTCLSEAKASGLRVGETETEARWVALATSSFFPLAGTPSAHPLRGQLERDDLAGFIKWLVSKYDAA